MRAARALFGVGATVIAVQGLSFLANLLVVRALPVAEYAILTSSLSILGLLSAISDSGLSQAALTVGGIRHHSESETTQVLTRCRQLVVKTGLVAMAVVIPVWVWMVTRLDGNAFAISLTGVFLFGGFFAVLGLNIYKSFLLLEGKREFTQVVEVAKTILRVVLLLAGLTAFPDAAFVIACGFATEIGAWWFFKHSLRRLVDPSGCCSETIRCEINSVFWRLMPSTIYKAISSQIFLLLLVAFGSVSSVAGAGALTRFHQFFMFIPSIAANIFGPRLAKTRRYEDRTRKLFVYTAAGWLGSLAIWTALVVLAGPLLSLLGPKYAGLQGDFRILMTSSCMYVMNGVLLGLLNTRGWIVPPSLLIGSDLLFTVLAISVCDASSLRGFTVMHCILNGGALLTFTMWVVFNVLTTQKDGSASVN